MPEFVSAQQVIDAIESAFASERAVAHDELVALRFRESVDANEMVAALEGKDWRAIASETLFYHRETLGMLGAKGYRSLVPAFMRASLTAGRKYGPDLMGYAISSFHALSNEEQDVATASDRLSLLTTSQRAAIALYLQHTVDEYQDREAADVLVAWQT